ncbi:hypothetical protein DFS34DRAFT_385310 [Phlyctochytrium arcticum]|nr:hypothetical protein DFS34DRAFT_385310 [Phlyctochytrium arcticum]
MMDMTNSTKDTLTTAAFASSLLGMNEGATPWLPLWMCLSQTQSFAVNLQGSRWFWKWPGKITCSYLLSENMLPHYQLTRISGMDFKVVKRDRVIPELHGNPAIRGVCGLERPDFWIDWHTHMLVVEVDEDQHWSSACECEQTRMVNISQSFGMPTVFLRWNPDDYRPKEESVPMVGTTDRLAALKGWIDSVRSKKPERVQRRGRNH